MKAIPSQPGQIYNHWTVLEERPPIKKHRAFLCRCQCGAEKVLLIQSLRRGDSKSCGCIRPIKHGAWLTTEYRTWNHIRQRCSNPNNTAWANYGGRGIRVCERWNSFEAFLSDVGLKPSPTHSLERIDNERGYEPDNCRWATMSEQARNRRSTRWRRIAFLLAKGRETELAEMVSRGRATDEEIAEWIGRAWLPIAERAA